MLDIFTDNWSECPTINDSERMLRIVTDNPSDELYAIVDGLMDEDEIEDEIRWSLRKKYGKRDMYQSYEDVSDLYRPTLFEEYELEAYLGDFVDDYDAEGIIQEVTFVRDGKRYWKPEMQDSDEFEQIVRKHEIIWEGEGWYRIGWSDGGMNWTSNGSVWFESEDQLTDEYMAAWNDATDTHLPFVEYKGDGDEPAE